MAQDDQQRIATTETRAVGSASGLWMRDSCGFYALRQGQTCRQPRSCFDCLNTPVATEPDGCFISPTGSCEPMAQYSPDADFRSNDSSVDSGDVDNYEGGWFHSFPSTNTTYCQAQDPACVRCHEIAVNASQANSYLASTTKYCTGINSCVCIVGCEAPTWKNRVKPECASTSSTVATTPPVVSTTKASDKSSMPLVWYFVLAQLPLFIVFIVIRARWLGSLRRKQRTQPSRQLELTGWRAMHDELSERDRNRPPHAESVLNSALPPSAPSVSPEASGGSARPLLMTRTERNVWLNGANSARHPTLPADRAEP